MKISTNKVVGIIILIVIIIIAVVFIMKDIFNSNNKSDEEYFEVNTPIEKYSKNMSSYYGFPFEIKCNNSQSITVEISDGFLFNNRGIIINKNESGNYMLSCNQIIYWNYFDETNEKNIETVNISFKSDNEKFQSKKFILIKNDNYEYYLSNNN